MRKIFFLALLLLWAVSARAQSGYTIASGYVLDPNGNPYQQCKGNAAFVPSPSATTVPLLNGSTFQTDVPINSCDSFGLLTIMLADNGVVSDGHTTPPASMWNFAISSQDGKTSFQCKMTITGSTQTITSQLQTCAPILPAGGGSGGAFVVKTIPCASSVTLPLAGTSPNTANTSFSIPLSCNVTSSSILGAPQITTGTQVEFNIVQNATGGFSFAWPVNFITPPTIQTGANQVTNASFWFNGTNWLPIIYPSSSGGGNYQTDQWNSVSLPQQTYNNFLSPLSAVNNSGNHSTDITCAIMVAAGAGHAAGCVPDPGATASPILPLCNNGTYSTACQGTATNSAIKPATADAMCFVTLEGNDGTGDGLSWGTAKATPYSCLTTVLPGSSTSPPTAGNGVVFISGNNIPFGGPAAPNGGWWMFGASDANYTAGKTGWMRAPTTGAVRIECAVPSIIGANGHAPMCQEYWGGNADNIHPPIWFSGFAGQASSKGLAFNYEGRGIVIGVDSNNSRSGNLGATSVELDSMAVNFGACTSGIHAGPGIDIGGNSFWIYLNDITVSGCVAEIYSIVASTGLSRSANVVTAQTTSTQDMVSGQTVVIRNATDPTFNGSYVLTFVDGTHFTYPNNGPNATSGGGQAFELNASAIAIDSGSGPGAGYVYVHDAALNNGGIWCRGGYNGCGLSAEHISYEGNFSNPDMPPVEILAPPTGDTYIYVNDVQLADNSVPICDVEMPLGGLYQPTGNINIQNATVCGSGAVTSGLVPTNNTATALRIGQFGMAGNKIVANIDAGRRLFSPSVARYANLGSAPGSFTPDSGVTLTQGQPAPDGTNNAVLAHNTNGVESLVVLGGLGGTSTPSIGQTFIWGVWIQNAVSVGTAPNPTPVFTFSYIGYGAGYSCAQRPGTNQTSGTDSANTTLNQPLIAGQVGDWNYYSGICKVYTVGGAATYQLLTARLLAGTSQVIYAPTVYNIPAGTISDNEAYEIANSLSSLPPSAVAGDVATLDGQRLSTVTLGLRNSGFQINLSSAALSSNQTVTFPSTAGVAAVVPLITGAITNTHTICASGTAGVYIDCTPSGGGGTPGGINLSTQYNNAGVFGGIPVPTSPNGVVFGLITIPAGGIGTVSQYAPFGIATRTVSSTTGTGILVSDRGQQVWYTSGSATTDSISAPSVTNFANWILQTKTSAATPVLFTPSAGLINGGANYTQAASTICKWTTSDNINLDVVCPGQPSVTTSGSPANGNLAKFSGALQITNGDLTGAVTTSGTLATTLSAAAVAPTNNVASLNRRMCDISIGDASSSNTITNAQLGPQKRMCFIPAAATIVEMDVEADAGTPNIIIGYRNPAGTVVNIVSAALATGAAGVNACSNTGGTTGLDGVTTCSATLQNTSIALGGYLEPVSGTAGGTARLMTIHVAYAVTGSL